MNRSLPSGIAVHSSGKSLILRAGLPEREIAAIGADKAESLAALRSEQMDPAGFYRTLPSTIFHELEAASWVVVDVITTAETLSSPPERLSTKKVCEGPETWLSYRAADPGTHIHSKRRMRILTVYTPELGPCAWDLDALTPEETQGLFRAALENKILIAHHAGVVLSSLLTETSARPSFVLDSNGHRSTRRIAGAPAAWGQAQCVGFGVVEPPVTDHLRTRIGALTHVIPHEHSSTAHNPQ
ncbi:MAG: hypothetical protein ABI164_08710 [Acidobacteriaceae bacterium]